MVYKVKGWDHLHLNSIGLWSEGQAWAGKTLPIAFVLDSNAFLHSTKLACSSSQSEMWQAWLIEHRKVFEWKTNTIWTQVCYEPRAVMHLHPSPTPTNPWLLPVSCFLSGRSWSRSWRKSKPWDWTGRSIHWRSPRGQRSAEFRWYRCSSTSPGMPRPPVCTSSTPSPHSRLFLVILLLYGCNPGYFLLYGFSTYGSDMTMASCWAGSGPNVTHVRFSLQP